MNKCIMYFYIIKHFTNKTYFINIKHEKIAKIYVEPKELDIHIMGFY